MSGEPPVETVVARLRPHGRALFWPSLVLVGVAGATGYFYGRFPEAWENIAVLGGAALLILLLWVIPVIAWLGRNTTITTRRVILRSGFLVRVRQELLLTRASDVTVRKSGLQGAFGSGDVLLGTGQDGPVVLRDVPNANIVQAALHDLIEAAARADAERRPRDTGGAPDETTLWGTR